MASNKLLIIEAPGKLKKLRQILPDWTIKASGGHIRELADAGEDNLGFSLDGDRITCQWIPRGKQGKETIAELRSAVKHASQVVLATDEDREGETIGWHLAQALGIKKPQRITYREITPQAVKAALTTPRPLNLNLVHAGVCRAVLDKLIGYRGSPLVWQLNNGAKAIGRVQSATLHLVVARELQIQNFQPQDYWSVWVDYAEGFRAFYHKNRTRPQSGVTPSSNPEPELDDAAEAGDRQSPESDRVLSQAEADRLVDIARQHPHQVIRIEGKTVSRTPPPPFTTSTLQQAAGAKLRFAPERTMELAQKLYEQGHITYHRTDSVYLSPEFCESARHWLEQHDPSNVPAKTTRHRSAKSAQEAHEAIRPTDVFRPSEQLRVELDKDAFALYVLIWKRTIASLCQPARVRQSKILTQSGEAQWLAKGQVVEFEGFAKYWRSLGQDVELPAVQQGQTLNLTAAAHEQKQTQPPPRYSEAQLVQLMERKAIGRPSTYAPTIRRLKEHQYVEIFKGKVHPTTLGIQLDRFLVQALPKLTETQFTADVEQQLDRIAAGDLEWQQWLTGWNQNYFAPALAQARKLIPEAMAAIATDSTTNSAIEKPGMRVGTSGTPSNQRYLQNSQKSVELSRTACPHCRQRMAKIKSSKVKKGHFLKCQTCENSVLFWSDRNKQWEAPKAKTQATFSDYPCPVCGKLMEEYHYTKEGQEKTLLRCSDATARQQKNHEGAVYFQSSKGGFWSPQYGELGLPTQPTQPQT